MLLASFISTQKMSVQKALAKKFKRFVAYKRDFVELLMTALQALVRDQLQYEHLSKTPPEGPICITCRQAGILN